VYPPPQAPPFGAQHPLGYNPPKANSTATIGKNASYVIIQLPLSLWMIVALIEDDCGSSDG
jgi:hypothetical protein